jgi:hypothetical protein
MWIRSIEEADLPAVARLLNVLSREFIVHESTPEGAATFPESEDRGRSSWNLGQFQGHPYRQLSD